MGLTVKSIAKKDAGRGIAAIPQGAMDERDLARGDYVVIESEQTGKQTIARAYPADGYDHGEEEVVHIDGELRNEVGTNIDEKVDIRAIDIEPANAVLVALPEDFKYEGDIKPHLIEKLSGSPARPGETLDVQLGFGQVTGPAGKDIPLHVVGTKPDGLVVITDATELVINEEPLEKFDPEAAKDAPTRKRDRDGPSSDDSDDSSETRDVGGDSGQVTYEDIGGLEEELDRVREMVEMPLQYPEVFQRLGIEPPKGVLLHGPPGTGKTMIAKAVANEVDASFFEINGPEIIESYRGESEENLRGIFEEAAEESPAIIFMDEVDAIAPNRDNVDHSADERLVNQLLSLMDGMDTEEDIIVIGATNRPDSIDNALRRGGRFDREIEIGVPDKDGRMEILHVHTRNMPLSGVDLEDYAEKTHGFVGADLKSFTTEAAMNALRRIRPNIDLEGDTLDTELLYSLNVYEEDFNRALSEVEPSAMREVFVEVPDVSWEDVGGLEETKQELQEMVQWPLEYDFLFDKADIDGSSGVLLYGPPGTGKTLLAKAVANESDANFISIEGPEVMSKWVGEAEEKVREVFDKARSNSPAVVFFDELDSIAGQRGEGSQTNNVTERVVSQLLTELDGMEAMENVVVIGATNRPDLIDDALKRTGRFNRQIEVGMPDPDARQKVFDVHLSSKPVDEDIDASWLAEQTDGYVGADIEGIVEEAAMIAMREFVSDTPDDNLRNRADDFTVERRHFDAAIDKVDPSVDESTFEAYEGLGEETSGNDGRPFFQ